GTVTLGNNTKGELSSANSGAQTPAGTAKFVLTAGQARLNNTVTTTDLTTQVPGYMEFNLRNNSGGDVTFGNNVEIAGTGLVVLNGLGSAPAGSLATM